MQDIARNSNPIAALREESEAARGLLANIRDIIGDDEDMIATAVEGETNLLEAIGSGVKRLAELDALLDSTKALADGIEERRARFKRQHELLKDALLVAMESSEIKKLELPLATISVKRTPASAMIVDESAVPSKFWKPQDPKLDKKAVLDALKTGEAVEGATLSNGGQALQVRFK